MRDYSNPKRQFQEDEYYLPAHWILRKAGLQIYLYKTRVMAELISKNRGGTGKALDVGCGDGRGTAELSRLLPDLSFVGIDFSERAITFARLMAPELEFAVHDGTALPYTDSCFDVITCREVIEHIPPSEIPEFLAEINRVLSPGGIFLLTTPSKNRRVPAKHYQHFTLPMLQMLVSQAGLDIVEAVGLGYWPPACLEKAFRFLTSLPTLWRIRSILGRLTLSPKYADNLIVLTRKAQND